MTSFSTIAGALPAMMAWGPGAEVRQPMAAAVVGGVVVSTVLTLFVVPALYALFDGLTARFVKSGAHARVAAREIAELDAEHVRALGAGGTGGGPPPPPHA